MTPVSAIVIFLVIWWLVLFMVLPFGVRRVETPEEGHDHGAPAQPMMWRKVAITTAIALMLFAIVYVIAAFDILTLHDLAIEL